MPNFDRKMVRSLEKLCRIECSEEEEQDLLDSLTKVLSYIEQLKEVDTEGVPTCRYVLRGMLRNQMRDDVVTDLLLRDKFLADAPDQIGGMIKVPPIMKPSF